jgi:hypothetical protein
MKTGTPKEKRTAVSLYGTIAVIGFWVIVYAS